MSSAAHGRIDLREGAAPRKLNLDRNNQFIGFKY